MISRDVALSYLSDRGCTLAFPSGTAHAAFLEAAERATKEVTAKDERQT